MSLKKRFFNTCGLTLIEISIVLAIIMIVSIPAVNFFRKQIEANLWESNRLSFRTDYMIFINRIKWELKQGKKATAELYNGGILQPPIPEDGDEGDEIKFEYVSPHTDIPVQVIYKYDFTLHEIVRIIYNYDSGTGNFINPHTVPGGMKGVQVSNVPGSYIFKVEKNFETVTITVAPYKRGPIPNGSETETLSTIVALRS